MGSKVKDIAIDWIYIPVIDGRSIRWDFCAADYFGKFRILKIGDLNLRNDIYVRIL